MGEANDVHYPETVDNTCVHCILSSIRICTGDSHSVTPAEDKAGGPKMSATAEELASAIRSLSVCNDKLSDDWIDGILDERQPRKRPKPPVEDWQILEDDFLKPSHLFSTEWLNKLQRYAYLPLYSPLFQKPCTE